MAFQFFWWRSVIFLLIVTLNCSCCGGSIHCCFFECFHGICSWKFAHSIYFFFFHLSFVLLLPRVSTQPNQECDHLNLNFQLSTGDKDELCPSRAVVCICRYQLCLHAANWSCHSPFTLSLLSSPIWGIIAQVLFPLLAAHRLSWCGCCSVSLADWSDGE